MTELKAHGWSFALSKKKLQFGGEHKHFTLILKDFECVA
jgi:hypothetical protein